MKWGRYWAPGVLAATALNAPNIYNLAIAHTLTPDTLAVRFAVAFVLCSAGFSFIADLIENYKAENAIEKMRRRRRKDDKAVDIQKVPDSESVGS